MKVIGLTGGIGSGKSTVADMFKLKNIPVYDSDLQARNLMNTQPELMLGITRIFGEAAYLDGSLNRGYIADIVFKDPEKLKALNALVHPHVRQDFLKWVDLQTAPYVVQEHPLIFEKQQQHLFDKVIAVVADKETRIKRVLKRDGSSRAQVLDRMANQLNDRDKAKAADFVIHNESLENTKIQVGKIHEQLLT